MYSHQMDVCLCGASCLPDIELCIVIRGMFVFVVRVVSQSLSYVCIDIRWTFVFVVQVVSRALNYVCMVIRGTFLLPCSSERECQVNDLLSRVHYSLASLDDSLAHGRYLF